MRLSLHVNGSFRFLIMTNAPFWFTWKIKKSKVFWCFQGDQKGTLGRKELIFSYLIFSTSVIKFINTSMKLWYWTWFGTRNKNLCVRQKSRRKQNQHFKLLFFKDNLHFGTTEQISPYGKSNLLPINSIYLVFSSRGRQRNSYRSMYTKIFLPCLKRNVSETFKTSSCKNGLPKCVYHW